MAENPAQDQKTEQPTPQKLEKALQEGQIAFSSELLGGLVLLTGMLFFLIAGRWFFEMLSRGLRERFLFVEPMIDHPETILLALRREIEQAGITCLAMILPITCIVLLASFMQTRFNISLKPLQLKWGKINPQSGIKRIFSTRSIARGLVAIAKATALITVVYFLTTAQWNEIASAGSGTFWNSIKIGSDLIMQIGILSSVLMVVVGIADYGFQWWKQRQELQMTLQEIRDENKDLEGDPQVKARIRRVANEMSKKRMMQVVPQATVVVTNPTHYAVALQYNPEASDAPLVIAKGVDHLALQIIKVAKENGVAVVERRSVARFLYHQVRIGQEIPHEMFQAVAEILSFIRELDRRES